MKKFFKALALVLALTLVIGCIPASAAEKKVKSSKVLYVGGAQGESADGTIKSALKGRVAIRKLAGYTAKEAKEHTFKAELVSGADIICGKKYVKATTLGKSVVAIYVDGEKVGETTITSKVNASEETLVIEGLEETAVVGKEYTVKLPRAKKDSDERKLFVNDVEIAESKDAARVYTVKFDKVGEYTVKAVAFQSAKLDKVLVSKEIKVNVVKPAATKAVQSAGDTVTVYFNDDASVLTAADFDIYWENAASAKIRDKVIKSATYNKDNNTVAIVCYSAFTAKTLYNIAVGENVVTFTGKSNTNEDIAKVEIATAQVIAGTFATVNFDFYDADDMKLSLSNAPTMVLEKVSGDANVTVSGNTIYFSKAGETAVVKAYYTTYDANYDVVKHYTSEKTIVGVDQWTAAEIFAYSLTTSTDKIDQNATPVHEVKATVDGYKFHLVVKQVENLTGNAKYSDLYDSADYYLESVDEKVIVVSGKWNITTVAPGVGTVVLKKASDKSVAAAFTITVKAAAYFNGYDISLNKTSFNTNTTDSIKFTLNCYDQYGDAFEPSWGLPTFAIKGGATEKTISDWNNLSWNYGVYEAELTKLVGEFKADEPVSVIFEVKAQRQGGSWDNIVKNVAVTAMNVTKAANTYVLEGAKAYDTAIATDTKKDAITASNTIALKTYFGSYAVAGQAMEFSAKAITTIETATAAAIDTTEYFYTVAKNGTLLEAGNDFLTFGADIKVNPYTVSGTAITGKIEKATYVVTAYKVSQAKDSKVKKAEQIAQTSFAITDSQVAPVVTQVKESLESKSVSVATAQAAFEAKFNGSKDNVAIVAVKGEQDTNSQAVVFTEIMCELTTKDGYTYQVKANGVPAVVK